MSGLRVLPLSLALALLSTGALCEPFPGPATINMGPVARMVWPQVWDVDEPVPVDGSVSEDPDGTIGRVSVTFGDGTYEQTQPSGTFAHLYPSAGTFDLRLEVADDEEWTAEVVGTIVLVERIETPVCSCSEPCEAPGICTRDGCFLTAMSDAPDDSYEPAEPEGRLDCGERPDGGG